MARKMKDSGIEWIGEIPERWEITKIKHIVSSVTDIDHFMPDSAEFGIPYLMIGDLKDLSSSIDWDSSKKISIEDYKKLSIKNRPQIGDIIFARYASIGTTCYIDTDRDFLVSYACLTIHPSDLIIGKFLSYYLKSSSFAEDVLRRTNSNTQGNIGKDSLVNATIVLPSIIEQTQIVNFLDAKCSDINAMLSKTRASIEEYKKLKQAVITQAVTKGVRGEREMKDSGVDYIGQIPAKWVLGKLRNVGDTQNGISKSSEFFGKGFPFVSYSDVYKNYSLPFAVSGLVESTPEEQERYSVKEGDIFFTRTSETIEEVGFSCVCEKDIPNATFAGFLIRVRPFSDKLHTPYAKYYFRSSHLRFYLVKEMNLVTRASLGQSLLKSMPVLLPPLEEQKEIADYLDAKCAEIDGLIAKKEQLVKELESYKKSLIYEVVTGKREV